MTYRRLTATAISACAFFIPWGSCAAADGSTVPASYAASCEDQIYRQDGLRLRIPRDYEPLLLTKVGTGQQLFSVAELASIEAAKKEYTDYEGAGWLFGIGKVSAQELHKMLCEDMSGRKLFAQDDAGNYYIFYHPTDVRYMRETPAAMQRDQEIWSQLCAWAWNDVPQHFIADNELISITADNSSVGIRLAQVIYKPENSYTLTVKGKQAKTGNLEQTTPFVNMLLYGNSYEIVQEKKKPQGEYTTLILPNNKTSLIFFQSEGSTYVLERQRGQEEHLYKSIPIEEHAEALTVTLDWYANLSGEKALSDGI